MEVDVSDGELPAITMVGFPDASVRESRERVQSAIRNSGLEFPRRHVTVNLSPADIRKIGAAFDPPMALGVLAATGLIPLPPPLTPPPTWRWSAAAPSRDLARPVARTIADLAGAERITAKHLAEAVQLRLDR